MNYKYIEEKPIRPDLAQWQKAQSEYFNDDIIEIVTEYAEWRDRRPIEVMKTREGKFQIGYSNTDENGGFTVIADITDQLSSLIKDG